MPTDTRLWSSQTFGAHANEVGQKSIASVPHYGDHCLFTSNVLPRVC